MSDRLATLLAAAEHLLAEGGAEALTMDNLATHAGVSRATAYRIVGSREQLLARLGKEEGGDTRARILAGARRTFARVGLEGATIEGVAKEAGVGAVTVYRQFGSKEGLISAFAADVGPRRAVRHAATPTDDPRADLERVATAALRGLAESDDLLRVVLGEACRNSPWVAHLQDPSVRVTESVATLLAAHMAAGRLRADDPARCARSFTGMLMAHTFFEPLLNPSTEAPPDADALAAHVTAVFLDGLGGPRAAR